MRGANAGAHRVKSIATGIPSLVSHLADHGYQTQSFYSNGHLNLRSGIERGFDGYVWYGATGHMAADSFDDWVRNADGAPWFAFVQMVDPHWPYALPNRFSKTVEPPDTTKNESMGGKAIEMFVDGVPEEDRQDFSEIYDLLVTYTDMQVEQILETLDKRGLRDNTLVVFHVDHGEELWDHAEWWHGHSHFRELVHLPSIFSFPGELPEGTRMPESFRAIDVLPTAIDLLGLPPSEHRTEGISLAHFLRGEPGDTPPPAIQESQLYGPGGDFAITEDPWRLIVQPMARWVDRETWEVDRDSIRGTELVMLFNIDEDPEERNNVASEHPERVADMRRRAEAILARARERKSGESEFTEMDSDADADALEALGYAGD